MVNNLYNEKIRSIDNTIYALSKEREELQQNQKDNKNRDGMQKWMGFRFESSSGLTAEFSEFAKDFKKHLKQQTQKEFDMMDWSRGHFYISGFLQHKKSKRFVYFSVSDVRFFRDEWFENVLIRTAENEKDYTGGINTHCKFSEINEKAKKLLKN